MNALEFVAYAVKSHNQHAEFHSGRWLPAGKNTTFRWRTTHSFISLSVYLYGHRIATLHVDGPTKDPSKWTLAQVEFTCAGYDTKTTHRWLSHVFSGVREFIPISVSTRDISLPKRLRATGMAAHCIDNDAREAAGMALYSKVRTITVNGVRAVFIANATYAVTRSGDVILPKFDEGGLKLHAVSLTKPLAKGRRIVTAYHRSLCATTGLAPFECMQHVRDAAIADGKSVPLVAHAHFGGILRTAYAAVARGAMPVHDALLLCTEFSMPPHVAEVVDVPLRGTVPESRLVEKIEELVVAYKRGGVR